MPGVGSGFLNAGLGRKPQEAEPAKTLRGLGPASTEGCKKEAPPEESGCVCAWLTRPVSRVCALVGDACRSADPARVEQS